MRGVPHGLLRSGEPLIAHHLPKCETVIWEMHLFQQRVQESLMKMETENLNQSSFVFKVLNGSLNGVEFTLGKQSHFICLNEEVAKQANLSDAARVLYIPVPNSGSNFSL